MTRHNGMNEPDAYNGPDRVRSHAGHPLSPTRWCVDDVCHARHGRERSNWKSAVEAPAARLEEQVERKGGGE